MSLKFLKMFYLLQELSNGEKKETTTATEIENTENHTEDERYDSKNNDQDAVEKVVKRRKKIIKRK